MANIRFLDQIPISSFQTTDGSNGSNPFPYTGSAEISGSLAVDGDVTATTYFGDGSNLTGINSNPFPYTGSAEITGSLGVTGSVEFKTEVGGTDFFIIKSGSVDNLKVNGEGIVQFFAYADNYTPTPVLGGIYFTTSSFYVGLE